MPPGMTAEAIIFAINSAIKLSNNIRKAYAQSIRSKALVLPLPEFDKNLDLNTIIRFFDTHQKYTQQDIRLGELHRIVSDELEFPDPETEQEYWQFYRAFNSIATGKEVSQDMSGDEFLNFLRIRQWEREGAKNEGSVLQIVAGSVVNIGIDLLLQVPGALNKQSAHGKVMHKFLLAFDEIDFAENEDIKRKISRRLLPRLFAAGAESLAALSPKIAEDEKLQNFIKEAAKGIAEDLYEKSKGLGAVERRQASYWGQVVLRSMINNAGTLVLNAPEEMFGTNGPVSDIIRSTGGALLDAILDDQSEKVVFRKAISVETLDRMAHATLAVVAEHPNIIAPGNQKGIRQIIGSVAEAVTQEDFRQKGLIPELARIVLEQSAGQLDLLWEESSDGPRHLLVTAAKEMLSLLSEKHGDAPWRPALTKRHLLEITSTLFDEVVQHPSWITDKAREGSVLSQVLDVTFRSLSQIPKEERISAATVKWLIQLNLQTTLTSPQVLASWKMGTDEEEAIILERALQLIFRCVFPPSTGTNSGTRPALTKLELLTELTEYVMEVVIRRHPGRQSLVVLELVLFDSGVDYSQGLDKALADELIDASLDALAAYPQLATDSQPIQRILSGIASAVNSSKLKQPGLLPFLAQVALEHTALNAHLIIEAGQGQPRQLLATALEYILTALSAQDEAGNWRPEITGLQAQGLIEELLDEAIRHPEWLTGGTAEGAPLHEVLNAVFNALEKIPKAERLAPQVLEDMIQLSLNTLLASPAVLTKFTFADNEEEKAILQRALELAFTFVFPGDTEAPGRVHLLEGLLDYILGVVISRNPDKKGLLLTELILFDSGLDYSQGFDQNLAGQLVDAALGAMASRPELLAKPEALKQIIAGLAGALDSSKLKQSGLLPRLTRLVLEKTALNANLLIDAEEDNPRHLLVVAIEQILSALSAQDEEGNWRPALSPAMAHHLLERLLDESVQRPFWITQKVNQESLLAETLAITFHALENIPQGRRLSPDTLELLLQLNLRTVAASPYVLRKISFADDADEKAILQRTLDLLFAFLFPAPGSNEAQRAYLLEALLEYILGVILANHPNERGLILVDLLLFKNNGIDYSEGFDEGVASPLVAAALEVLSQQPELLSHDKALKKIIGGVAEALYQSGLERKGLLRELIRLSLEKTADNLGLLFDIEEENPENLLAIAAGQVLKAIALEPRSGKWKPRLTNGQALDIIDLIYDTLLTYPKWARTELLIFQLMEAVFRALEAVPPTLKLAYDNIRYIIEMALEAASRQRHFLAEIQVTSRGHKHIMLRFALEGLFEVVYVNNSEDEQLAWHLSQPTVVETLVDFYLSALVETPGSKKDFQRLLKDIEAAITLWKEDFAKPILTILDTLESENS